MTREKDIHALARAIEAHLPGFEYVDDARQRDGDGNLYCVARLTSIAEAPAVANPQATVRDVPWTHRVPQLYLSSSHTAKGKLSVSLDVPHVELSGRRTWLGDALRHKEQTVSINVDPTRDPRAIAADITRRLLPAATAQWETMLTWLADQEAYAADQADVCEQLRAMGATFHGREPNNGHFTFGEASASFHVQGSSVRFDYLSITAEQACMVLQALRSKP